MGRFDGKVVWITGGGTGIGAACARRFAAEGATVAVSGRRADRLEEVAAEVGGMAVPCDVVDPEACRAAAARITEAHGGIDVVMANAGYGVVGRLADLPVSQFHRQFEVNVFGVLHTVQAALPSVIARQGRVVLVGSVAAFVPLKKNGAYVASKAAVRMLGETLTVELTGTGATCTTLVPGFVASEIHTVDNEGEVHPDRKDRRPAALIWSTERAAATMVDAVHRRKVTHVFTGHGKVIAALARISPALLRVLARRM